HREIYIGGEFPLLPSLASRYSSTVEASRIDEALRDIVGCDAYGNLARRSLTARTDAAVSFEDLYAGLLCPQPVRLTGNKTPQNPENVASLERLFPGARYILIVRDIRDVALSWKSKWGKDPYLCAHRWDGRMRLALESLERLAPGRHLVVKYESLLDDHVQV